jgi:hypothetical protein
MLEFPIKKKFGTLIFENFFATIFRMFSFSIIYRQAALQRGQHLQSLLLRIKSKVCDKLTIKKNKFKNSKNSKNSNK